MKAVHPIVRSFTGSQTSKAICIVGRHFLWLTRRKFSCDRIVDDGAILPVLIVGAGPVGLVLSILLTKLGVFRKLDGLAGEIQSAQPPLDLWRKFIYCTSLSGKILGSVDHIQPQDLEQSVSPVFVAHFSQYKLTQLLLKRLENLDFHIQSRKVPDDVRPVKEEEILMGHELLSICASENCLNVKASFHEEGKYMEKIIRCAFLVGADGAGSTVRRLSGIEMIGESDLQKLVSVHFISKDLGDYLIKERPGMLFFIFNSEAIGVLVAHDLRQGEFVLQVPFYPPQQTLEDFSPRMCGTLISKLVGQELEDINVMDIKPWIMHAEVADKFLSLHERVIIAGDAAHRFPPAGGFGMNTGIQDAHNLAWKLASVVNGVAPTKLLKTYETERKPVATNNTQLSVQNFRAAMAVPSALGLDPKIATSVHGIINDGIGSVLPSGLQRLILDGVFSIGRAQVVETVLNDNNPLGSSRLAKLNQVFEDGKSLQLQFPAEDLGFRYLRGALVGGGDTSTEPPSGHRRAYIPSAEPGARLPHMTVRTLSNGANEGILSTHDLLSGNKVEFLLIISPLKGSYNLACATINIAKKFKVTVKVGVVWPSGDNTDKESDKVKNSLEFLPPATFVDVVEEKKSSTSPSWWEICQMSDRGAILVRPDEHIAWCSKSGDVGDPVAEMEKVFSTVLGFV